MQQAGAGALLLTDPLVLAPQGHDVVALALQGRRPHVLWHQSVGSQYRARHLLALGAMSILYSLNRGGNYGGPTSYHYQRARHRA